MKSASSTDGNAYRKAAAKVADRRNKWSCCAIANVPDCSDPYGVETTSADRERVHAYTKVFRPDGSGTFWGQLWDREGVQTDEAINLTEAGRDCRILALCFMAAMVEAGDA